MSRARNLANLLDANGDVASGALDNVPASDNASALTTGTLPIARIADGDITAAKLGSTLNLSGKTVTLDGLENDRTGSGFVETLQDKGRKLVNTSAAEYEERIYLSAGMYQHIIHSFNQTTTSRWFKVNTPQSYSDTSSGGSAKFVASYHTAHAAGCAMKEWHMAFGNNHGRVFQYSFRNVTDLKVGDSYYGWNPQVHLYKKSTSGDSEMRELYVEFRDYPGGYSQIDVMFEIKGVNGGGETFAYTLTDLGSSTPSGISLIESMT